MQTLPPCLTCNAMCTDGIRDTLECPFKQVRNMLWSDNTTTDHVLALWNRGGLGNKKAKEESDDNPDD